MSDELIADITLLIIFFWMLGLSVLAVVKAFIRGAK